MVYLHLLLGAVVVVVCMSNYGTAADVYYKRVCYFENTASPSIIPTIDPFLCTHIVFSYGNIQITGAIKAKNPADTAMYAAFVLLKNVNPDLKLILRLADGGIGDNSIESFLAVTSFVDNFIGSVISFLRTNGLDGLEIKYRGSGSSDLLRTFLSRVRNEFDAEVNPTQSPLLLTANLQVQTVINILSAYTLTKVSSLEMYFDFVTLSTVEMYTSSTTAVAMHHSRLFRGENDVDIDYQLSTEYSAQFWALLGMPRDKIVIEMAAYGIGFTLSSTSNTDVGAPISGASAPIGDTNTAGLMSYREICLAIASTGFSPSQDNGMPYFVNVDQWIGYDDVESIEDKVDWLVQEGYAGAAVSSFHLDDYNQECGSSSTSFPIITRMSDALQLADLNRNRDQTSDNSSTSSNNSTNLNCTGPQPPALPEYRRVCYYTTWSANRTGAGKFMPEDIDPNLCTHIIVAFAKIEDNQLAMEDPYDETIYTGIENLKVINPELKTLLSVGGWSQGSADFSSMVAKPKRRRRFVESVIQFLRNHSFDGLDLAWQFPALRPGSNPSKDKANYAILVQLLRREFDSENPSSPLLLSLAVSAMQSNIDYAYDVPAIAPHVDFISILTFDMHGYWEYMTGHHSALYKMPDELGSEGNLNIEWASKYWLLLGATKDQLNIGLATFGRGFTLSQPGNDWIWAWTSGPNPAGPYTNEPGMLAYYEICELVDSGDGTVTRVKEVPYYVNDSLWIGYDDEESIAAKVDYIIREEYGGAMVWALGLDDFSGNCSSSSFPSPLLSTVVGMLTASESGVYTRSEPDTTTTVQTTTISSTTTGAPFISCDPDRNEAPIANPNDCTTFYKCAHGIAHLYHCPGNLVFNIDTLTCDYDGNTACD